MNRSLVLRRLYWKEFRQLWPLVLMLAVIGLLFQILIQLSDPSQINVAKNLFLLGLPGLFAAGIGALLVGQERDHRTLYWMVSLPVFKQDIIRVKFLAGLLGLASVWIISFALHLVSNRLSRIGPNIFSEELDISYGILYSIFLLTVSFATAWTFRSTFVGLLVLVGVAMAYTFVTNLLTFPKSSDGFTTAALLLASAVSLWLGWLAALRALAPIAPPRFPQRAMEGASFFDRAIVDRRIVQTPWSALIWQFSAQNRAMLFGLAGLFFTPLLILAMSPTNNQSMVPAILLVFPFVSISWLGVIAFQGDNLHQRIRFLSDRGISPKTIWLTRQAIPVGMLIVGVLAVVVVAACVLYWSQNEHQRPTVGLFVLLAGGLMWTIYSVTQWMSQIVRSPVISAILGPVVACLPLAYGAFALDSLETPVWILAATTCIPMIASFRMTRHWMDSRMGKSFWFEHVGWLVLLILLPAIPFLIVYFTYPSMPVREWATFSADARRLSASDRQPIEINLLPKREPYREQTGTELDALGMPEMGEAAGGEAGGGGSVTISGMGMGGSMDSNEQYTLPENKTLAEERELQLEFIDQQLKSFSSSMPISGYSVGKRLMAEAMLARTQMQDDKPTEELLQRYQRTVGLFLRLAEGVRSTSNLKSQQIADQYEAWLVQELQSPGTDAFMGTELRTAAITQLGNKAGRQNARYRALVSDWAKSQAKFRSTPDHTLGGYSIPTNKNGTRLISKRHVSTVAWRMKQYLMASDSAAMNQAKEALALDWNTPISEFGSTATPYSMNPGVAAPWIHWFGDWEKQADAFGLSK